jgi:hypothetical protein
VANVKPGGQVARPAVPALEETITVDESKIEFRKNIGIWWPIKLWESEFKRKHDPKNVYLIHDETGCKAQGIIMDSKYGESLGTVSMSKIWNKGAKSTLEIDKSSRAFHCGQLADSFDLARKQAQGVRFNDNSDASNTADGVSLSCRAAKKQRVDNHGADGSDDSSGDWIAPALAAKERKR